MKKKKSQMKMAESIAILVIFFFLLIFGFSFYARISGAQYESKRQEGMSQKAVDVAQVAAFLPEIKCSLGAEEEVIVTDVCIDTYKLDAAKTVIEANPDYYYDIIGYAHIDVKQIYPETTPPNPPFEKTLYTKIPDDYTRKTIVYIPSSLYNPVEDSYAFGYMQVEVYLK